MKKERVITIILVAALTASLVFGISRELLVRELREQARQAREEYSSAADSLRRELQDAGEERKALRTELDGAALDLEELRGSLGSALADRDELRAELQTVEAELSQAEARIEELQTRPVFDPDGPEYQLLYPDFYAPQPLDASSAPEGVIYLTFDDGPSARTDEVLKILEQEGIKATFFIVGRSGASNGGRLRAIAGAGHTLAMHSWSHDYKKIYGSVEDFLADMYEVFKLIRDETCVTPTYFRFPGGSTNAQAYGIIEDIMAEMLRRGFVPCDWNMSAQDATSKPLPASEIISNVLSSSASRGVVLMHDSSARTTTVEALPGLISALRERGFTFAPLTPDVKPVVFGYRTPKLED